MLPSKLVFDLYCPMNGLQTQTVKEDWRITYEPSKQRYADGVKEIKQGKEIGFAKMMYTRVFYQDDSGNTANSRVL